jgi:hypothetical protein
MTSGSRHLADQAADDNPDLDNLIDETITVWQPYSADPLTREDARQIMQNVTAYFDMLLRWAAEDRERAEQELGQAARAALRPWGRRPPGPRATIWGLAGPVVPVRRIAMRRNTEIEAAIREASSRQAVLYARVSSKEQEREGYSIPAQEGLLRGYALEHGLDIVREFDEVETAKDTGRSKFTEMLAG